MTSKMISQVGSLTAGPPLRPPPEPPLPVPPPLGGRGAPPPWPPLPSREGISARWVLLGPVKAYFTTTEGGAAINEQMQVLDEDDRPIPGLYAVGQNGLGGMVLWGHGLHIAWAITSGRLAGTRLGELARRREMTQSTHSLANSAATAPSSWPR